MSDVLNPDHYKKGFSNSAEVIDIAENLNYNRGNAVKYLARAGQKDPDKEIEDVEKALWYVKRELGRLIDKEYDEQS
jgi:hypothetical protein|tara:strand:+ start:410 stop:640 length:231 start_codon:yes stop_codon:yes gene_type:complete